LIPLAVGVLGVPQLAPAQAIFKEGQGARKLSPTAWDTVWVFGGRDHELASATSLVPDGRGGVFFADPLLSRVYHVDPDGRLDWSWGREGSGPGEVRDIRAMTLNGSADLVLVDSGNRRIVTLSSEGRLLSEVPLSIDAGYVSGVVSLQSDRFVMATDGSVPWILVDRAGKQVQVVDTPSGVDELSVLQRFGFITKWKQDRWVFGFQNGNGWFTFRSSVVELASPYVEHTGFPSSDANRLPIGEMVHSAVSLSARGDTLTVLFAGSTRGQFYWLDRYELQTGAYFDSLLLPRPAKQAVVGSQGLVFVVTHDMFPTLMALRPQPMNLGRQRGNND
jgi:hypothetical protein